MPALIGSIAARRWLPIGQHKAALLKSESRSVGTLIVSGTVATMSVVVADNTMENRYEAWLDGALAGVSQYELTSDSIVFLHTVVAEKHEGQGVASAIARYALDDARARGLQVRPLCPYIRGWIGRHSEYADLVAHPR
jgi:uncharacterized protein